MKRPPRNSHEFWRFWVPLGREDVFRNGCELGIAPLFEASFVATQVILSRDSIVPLFEASFVATQVILSRDSPIAMLQAVGCHPGQCGTMACVVGKAAVWKKKSPLAV